MKKGIIRANSSIETPLEFRERGGRFLAESQRARREGEEKEDKELGFFVELDIEKGLFFSLCSPSILLSKMPFGTILCESVVFIFIVGAGLGLGL